MKAVPMTVLITHLRKKPIIKRMMIMMMKMILKIVKNLMIRMKFLRIILVLIGKIKNYNNRRNYKRQKMQLKGEKMVRRKNLLTKMKKVRNQNKVKKK